MQAGFTVTLSTAAVAGDVQGYGGPINLLVSVSDQGIINGVRLVQSKETPSYITGIEAWLAGLQGRSILKPPYKEVDAISGATITCKAITQILSRTGDKIREPLLGLPPAPSAAQPQPWWKKAVTDKRFWLVIVILGLFAVVFHSRSRRLRLAFLAVSLIVVGWHLNAPFTSQDAAGLCAGKIPAMEIPWRVALFVGVLLISVLWGQAFCGYMCPFGALLEFIGMIGLRTRVSPAVEQPARYLKFVVLALVISLFLVTDDRVWFSFSPLQQFFSGHMEAWVLGISCVVLITSAFYFRFWCRYLCPAGAFLALFNKVSLMRAIAPTPVPGRCDLGVSFTGDVDCIKCHRCLFRDESESASPDAPMDQKEKSTRYTRV